MLGDKSEHFEGKGTNLTDLETHITQYLEERRLHRPDRAADATRAR